MAASLSTARSASTFCMSGWSTSEGAEGAPVAGVVDRLGEAARTVAAEPRTQSSRVVLTISMMVRHAAALLADQPARRAVELHLAGEALDRSPSLSLSRCSRNTLRLPSGSTRGTRKQETPSSSCASTRNRSLIGAEVNHLWPVSA